MHLILLTHAEAADPAVLANVQKLLASAEPSHLTVADETDTAREVRLSRLVGEAQAWAGTVPPIGQDAPDIGATPEDIKAREVFAPLVPAGAPSIAGAAQSQTAPVAPPPAAGVSLPTVPATCAPPTVPVAPAPLAPAAPPSPAGGVALDSDGLPWDARIHAGSKGTNKDGRWTAKRNLNDGAYIAAVQAELRQLMAIPPGGAPAAMPAPPAPPAPPAAPVPPVAAQAETFAQFMARLAPFTISGQITPERIQQVGAELGYALSALQQRPDLIPAFAAKLGV